MSTKISIAVIVTSNTELRFLIVYWILQYGSNITKYHWLTILLEWYSCFPARRLKQICLYYLHYLHKKMAEGFFFPLSKDLSLLWHLLEQLSPESLSYLCKGSSYICTKFYIQKNSFKRQVPLDPRGTSVLLCVNGLY